jgi:type IV secretion system protein VirB10
MSGEEPTSDRIEGERDTHAARASAQSRMSNLLAVGLMSALGLGSLTWYYANALKRQDRIKQSASAASARTTQGDVPLPSLGRIDPPAPLPSISAPQMSQGATPLAEVPLAPESRVIAYGSPAPKTPSQLAMDRELSGAVFAPQSTAAPAPATTNGAQDLGPDKREPGELGSLLRPAVTSSARAHVLPTRRFLLAKGAFIDCTLETAIDSTLPGMTTCVMATDTFGVDGTIVLMERGTKLIGETRGQVQQGSARVFVIWTEARTPAGIVVPLDSPGADELGRSGLPGVVSRHFWERFGSAMLVSVIDGAVQGAVQSSRGGANVVVNPASQDVLTEILKNTINIPPTVVKQNGDRIQVLVARDVDFRSVYELRSTAP